MTTALFRLGRTQRRKELGTLRGLSAAGSLASNIPPSVRMSFADNEGVRHYVEMTRDEALSLAGSLLQQVAWCDETLVRAGHPALQSVSIDSHVLALRMHKLLDRLKPDIPRRGKS